MELFCHLENSMGKGALKKPNVFIQWVTVYAESGSTALYASSTGFQEATICLWFHQTANIYLEGGTDLVTAEG